MPEKPQTLHQALREVQTHWHAILRGSGLIALATWCAKRLTAFVVWVRRKG